MKRVVIGLLLAAVLLSAGYILLHRGDSGQIVRVSQGGEVVWEQPLDRDGEFRAPGNVIEVRAGRVRVSQADCPDQVCVNQGWISDKTVPIVCLPNQLIVQIEGGGSLLDGQTG